MGSRRALALSLVGCLLAGCSLGQATAQVSIEIVPAAAGAEQPFDVIVSGVTPGETVGLALRSTDDRGVAWSAAANYLPGSSGRLDLARDAPRSGSYSGASGTGLLWSMRPSEGTTPYFWGKSPMTFRLEVSKNGQRLADRSFSRSLGASYSVASESLSAEGFVGRFYSPPAGPPHTAVLVVGGSGGGIPGALLPAHLASDGYPTLALAYFGEPGLPQTLGSIPLEYFASALRWLAKQPGVDAQRVVVMGVSRGSEASMLVAANYPDLVHGLVASVPSNVAICAYPGCGGPAWTLRGVPLPYTTQFNNPAPTDEPAAVIPVERIRGAILLDCGGVDRVWDSCPYAHAIMDRLNAHAFPFPHDLAEYPRAGHGVGELVPYEPGLDLGAGLSSAGTASDSNELARQLLWPKVLAFLAAE